MKKNIILLLSSLVPFCLSAQNAVAEIRKQIEKDIARSLQPSDDSMKEDSIFCYNELLKINVDSKSKIQSIEVSDGSSDWFSAEISRLKKKGHIKISEIEQICKKRKFKNGSILFPIIIASFGYDEGCYRDKAISPTYYKFRGLNLSGSVFFADRIDHIQSIRWRAKSSN
ncbi:hypothetical protein LQ567_00955 [Niabella pedocola]|uniref:Uncharacterized protein n=1 Tax=Niabella pedocola TaxID=1752077 RepID=A0ABS8PNG0_9BACT|nr:hypothetical protein [Niabella pedocola]MCD2421311.1 hypothetical protein [Niabella pedocola]